MDFGKYAEYMALGYVAMGVLLGGMVLWLVVRYRALIREEQMIAQMEAEERAERAASGPVAPHDAGPLAQAAATPAGTKKG